jgi:hypothetical protein
MSEEFRVAVEGALQSMVVPKRSPEAAPVKWIEDDMDV